MCLYHYTKGIHLISIVRDGYIKRSNAFIEKREQPAVHLTYSIDWEPTVWLDKLTTLNSIAGGKARILIKDTLKVVTWDDFLYASGVSRATYELLTNSAIEKKSPIDQWRLYFGKITKTYWEGVEIFNGYEWLRWNEITPIEDFVLNVKN